MRRAAILTTLAMFLGACTFQPGTGFSTLRQLDMTASLDAPAVRYDSAGRWKTDNEARMTIETLWVDWGELAIQGAAIGGALAFDPAKPPPGYSLCHNGHCHRDDGTLVDYGTIRAEMAGGQAHLPPLLQLPIQRLVALGETPVTATVEACGSGCVLEPGAWQRVVVTVSGIQASGTVEDGGPDGPIGSVPRRWAMTLGPVDLSAELPVTIDRQQAPDLALRTTLRVSQRLFDGLPWAQLVSQPGEIALDGVPEAKERLQRNVMDSALHVGVDRLD